jgi:TonB family protein
MDPDNQDPTDGRWQPYYADSPEEAITEPRPVLSQPEELREPWVKYEQAPENSRADHKLRHLLVVVGIAGGVLVLALVAWGVLLRPHRAEIAALVGDLKKLASGETSTTDAGQPSGVAASSSRSTFRAHRPRHVHRKGELSGEGDSSAPSAATPSIEASRLPQQPNPPQLEVVEMNNLRRLVQPPGIPVVRVHWDDLGVVDSPSLESASLATTETPKGNGSQGISGGGPEQQEIPTYAPVALRNNVQGTVVLRVVVGKDGTVQSVRLLSGPPMLASAVVDAVQEWRYKPYYRNGEPVAVETQITVEFTISMK